MSTLDFEEERRKILAACDSGGACVRSCEFLQRNGTPRELAEKMAGEAEALGLGFSCSLCGLCSALCPKGADPLRLLLAARGEALRKGYRLSPGHLRWVAHEDRGLSERYSLLAVPRGGDAVFFPGCSLPGKRPDAVKALFEVLSRAVPGLGVSLSCCSRPSRDLGLFERSDQGFSRLARALSQRGVKKVITACPGCYQVFAQRGEFTLVSAYEILAEKGPRPAAALLGTVAIHDPCVARNFPELHASVRELVSQSGLAVSEMANSRQKTLCCGEGGCVAAVAPELARTLSGRRKAQAGENPTATYCSGCISSLGGPERAFHILDLLVCPEKALAGKIPSARPPVTYLNRLVLKRYFRKAVSDG